MICSAWERTWWDYDVSALPWVESCLMEPYLQPRINCQPKSTVYVGHCTELPRPGGPEWFTLYNMILPSSSFTTAQTVQKEPGGLAPHMLQMTEKHLCVLQQNPSRFYMPEHVLVGSSCKIGSYWFLFSLYMGKKKVELHWSGFYHEQIYGNKGTRHIKIL